MRKCKNENGSISDEAGPLHQAVPGTGPSSPPLPAGPGHACPAPVPGRWLASSPSAALSGRPPSPLLVLLPETPARATDARGRRRAGSCTRCMRPTKSERTSVIICTCLHFINSKFYIDQVMRVPEQHECVRAYSFFLPPGEKLAGGVRQGHIV